MTYMKILNRALTHMHKSKSAFAVLAISFATANSSLADEYSDSRKRALEMQRIQDDIFRQRKEIENIKRQQDEIEFDRFQQEAALRKQALDMQQQKRAAEIEQVIAGLEQQIRSGQGLLNDQVEWVKATGMLARNVPSSEYRPYLSRLTVIFNTEKLRRGK